MLKGIGLIGGKEGRSFQIHELGGIKGQIKRVLEANMGSLPKQSFGGVRSPIGRAGWEEKQLKMGGGDNPT